MFDCISYTVPEANEPTPDELLEQEEAEAMPPWWVAIYIAEWQERDGAPDRAEQ